MRLDVTKDETLIPESDFYKKILKIPFIRKSYFKLLNDKTSNLDVEEFLPDMKEMYEPILAEMSKDANFNDAITLNSNTFKIKNNENSRKYFADNMPSEVLKNMSLTKYGNFLIKN